MSAIEPLVVSLSANEATDAGRFGPKAIPTTAGLVSWVPRSGERDSRFPTASVLMLKPTGSKCLRWVWMRVHVRSSPPAMGPRRGGMRFE